MTDKPHLTTRRGFIAAAGLGGTALYGLWVGYGAAPGPLALFGAKHADDAHGIADNAPPQTNAMTPEAFEARVQEFIQRFGAPDGSVRPRLADAARDTTSDPAHAGHAPLAHDNHGAAAHGDHSATTPHAESPAPIDVWLQAGQFFFAPWHLRLEAHQPYRFRMMATDVAHGASVQFGRGGRMIRLRPGQLVDTEMRLKMA